MEKTKELFDEWNKEKQDYYIKSIISLHPKKLNLLSEIVSGILLE